MKKSVSPVQTRRTFLRDDRLALLLSYCFLLVQRLLPSLYVVRAFTSAAEAAANSLRRAFVVLAP